MKTIFTPAMAELRAAINEAEQISAKSELTKRDEARVNVLLAKIAALRQNAVAPDNYAERWLRAMFTGAELPERRDDPNALQSGQQTPTYSQGPFGGYIVPQEFHNDILLGLTENDPLFDENLVTVIKSNNFALKPLTVPAWDLSTYIAYQNDEGNQFVGDPVPTVSGHTFGGYSFAAAIDASLEFEEDAFQPTVLFAKRALTEAFAKGVGQALVSGSGTGTPSGLLTGAVDSGYTTEAAGAYSNNDLDALYFSVNKRYRRSPKCAWVMADETYQLIKKSHDNAGRPLISVVDGQEQLYGKKIVISPNWESGPNGKSIGFGDLSYFVVRLSRMILFRRMELPGYVENGKAQYGARMRVDSKLIDPTNGNYSPFKYLTEKA
jgi:HK97 family phage major capsid protein